MPYVNIKVTGGSEAPTKEQKATIIKGVTELLFDVLGKDPSTTFVVIDEIEIGVDPISWTDNPLRRRGSRCRNAPRIPRNSVAG